MPGARARGGIALPGVVWPALLAGALSLGCGSDATPPPPSGAPPAGGWPSVVAEDGESDCADVLDLRVCWDGALTRLVPRALPDVPTRSGLRCHGAGAARRCFDRSFGAGPFACDSGSCVQRWPRLPDQGAWECMDVDGAVLCRGWAPAAGVPDAPPDPGFRCGPRRRHEGERVCLDLSPDRPPGAERGTMVCFFAHGVLEERRCRSGDRGPAIGGPCGSCPAGTACVSDRCLPLRPEPACWLDEDCGDGAACALGSCRPRGEP